MSVAVPNARFEAAEASGGPAQWTKTAGSGSAIIDSAEKVEGSSSLRMEAGRGQEIQISSEKLDLQPLRRYRLEVWVKRTLGNEISFLIEDMEPDGTRLTGLQLHWPDRYQPNWFLPYPGWTKYHAYFATGRKESAWRLVIKERCLEDRLGKSCWMDGLSLKETGKVQLAARPSSPGVRLSLLPLQVAEFTPDESGMPMGWGIWWGDRTRISILKGGASQQGDCLRVRLDPGSGGTLCFAAPCVFVKEGMLYRFSLNARGKGTVSMAIHQLGDGPGYWCRADTALRVGSSHPRDFGIDSKEWKRLEVEHIAEIPEMRWFNPYLVIGGEVDVSDACLEGVTGDH